jgi:hypothetical protein
MEDEMTELKFGSLDGDAVVWGPGEAWVCSDGKWSRGNSSEVGMDARLLSRNAFRAKFGDLPPLPETSFPHHRSG